MARKDTIYAKPIINCGDEVDVGGERWFIGALFAEEKDDPNNASHALVTFPGRPSTVVSITKKIEVIVKSRAASKPMDARLRGCQRCGVSLSGFEPRVKICPDCERRMARINKPLADFA